MSDRKIPAYAYQRIRDHYCHSVEVVGYGKREDGEYENIAIECLDCNEVIVSEDFRYEDKEKDFE